ncbi:MAG: glycosyltransferase family 9 protein [Burkholderiaceae bacterium]|nr:glycosyltransferase family 9 protein [Burkholderiaceae bacterium]
MGNNWAQVRNLLCVRLDSLGDVLMTSPALRALKQGLGGVRLSLLTSPAGAAGAVYMPEVDETLIYLAPWMKHERQTGARADVDMIRLLRRKKFDAAVIFTSYSQSPLPAAMLCHYAGIPLSLAHCRENPYWLLSDRVRETEPEETIRHEVRRQLDLVAAIGCIPADERLSFRVPPEALAWARRHLPMAGFDLEKPWLLLHPGATASSRRYPPRSWAEALNLLHDELQCPVLLCGGVEEMSLIKEIRGELLCPNYSLAGQIDLGRFAAVVALAPVLLANNSGPAHLAAALGTPVVDLYALTNFQHAPWGVPHRILYHEVACAPCYKSVCPHDHHDCLQKVSPARVAQETLSLLHEVYGLHQATKVYPGSEE